MESNSPSGDNCRTQLDKYIRDHRALADREEKLDRLEKQLQEIQREKRDADLAITELRQRVTSLQQELDTSEAVQKDFVRLSQSLQVKKQRTRLGRRIINEQNCVINDYTMIAIDVF